MSDFTSKRAEALADCCQAAYVEGFKWCETSLVPRAYQDGLDATAAENERLRTALEWIAHRCPKIYETSDDPHRAHVEAAVDAGNCARAAVPPERSCDTCRFADPDGVVCHQKETRTTNSCGATETYDAWEPKDETPPTDDTIPGPLARAALGGGGK